MWKPTDRFKVQTKGQLIVEVIEESVDPPSIDASTEDGGSNGPRFRTQAGTSVRRLSASEYEILTSPTPIRATRTKGPGPNP